MDNNIKRYKLYVIQQLKQILKEFLIEKKIKPNFRISKLKKAEVISKLIENNYDIRNLPEPIKNLRSNIARATVKQYTDEEQEQFLNKGYEVIDPLKAKGEYFNIKTGQKELVKLLTHQEKFLRKFFLSGVSGSIVFHGVGTGKSLTASVASHYYLSLNPNGNVIFISPPALILNFVNALKQYGLDEKDKRIYYYTFEKFTRNPSINKDKPTLFIIDEAHLLRSEIKSNTKQDEEGNQYLSVEQNKRGFAILNAIKKTDKCILLTGTPFINKIYDIENLLSMVVKKDPLDPDNFSQMITNTNSRLDYFKYKISHYENKVGSEYFPEKIEKYIPFIMNDDELDKYKKFENGNLDILDNPDLENINFNNAKSEKSFTSFYNGTRQYSNILDYKKIAFIIDRIKKKQTTGKFIIYTTFIDNGLRIIKTFLDKNNITYATISGNENIKQKEESKNKYNSGEVNVLLITKAGTEGIDTIGTEAIFIYEGSSWNEPLVEQAVARAIRFKSHYHLPKEFQKVYVYRLLIIKKIDEDIINKINNNEIYSYRTQLQKYKKIDDDIKTQKLEENNNIKKDFEKTEYKKLSDEEKNKYLEDVKYERYAVNRQINKLFEQIPSIEARLTVMALAKKEQVLEFINELDNNIQQLEDYETPFEKDISLKKLDKMTEKEILDLQRKYINEQKENIFKLVSSDKLQKLLNDYERRNNLFELKMDVAKRLQAYFTPDKVIKQMLEYSKKLKGYQNLNILEPTAGIGNIPIYIMKNFKGDYKINMVEIDDKNRDVLKDLVKTAPDILNLYNENKNFLRFINPIQYDLIIMNPPFHLRKSTLTYLKRDYYDIDFVKRAFYMLKKGGELIALVSRVYKENDKKWLNEYKADIIDINVKNWTDTSKKTKEEKKATTINNINLSIIIMNKNDDIGLKEMNIEIDPDLTPSEEKKAIDYNDGVGAIAKENKKELPQEIKEAIEYMKNPSINLRREKRLRSNDKIIQYFNINSLNKYKKFQEDYPGINLTHVYFNSS
jgi:tRNA1(Val) A37 N6-methylase TrmN6